MKIGWIGLGVMGYPMAGHLAAAGHDLRVYNRTAAKADAWTTQYGGSAVATPAAAAENAQVVFSCVGDDDDLRVVARPAVLAAPALALMVISGLLVATGALRSSPGIDAVGATAAAEAGERPAPSGPVAARDAVGNGRVRVDAAAFDISGELAHIRRVRRVALHADVPGSRSTDSGEPVDASYDAERERLAIVRLTSSPAPPSPRAESRRAESRRAERAAIGPV